jgi:acetyl esterase/lipase
MGAPEIKDVENRLFASELKCAIYSADHRLAPEAPHPAPLEDIYSVFAWLHANAGQLGLDPARIGIKGESGGGGRRRPHFTPATGRDQNLPFSI